MDRDTWRRVAYSALWLVGLAAAVGVVALGMTDDRVAGVRLDIVLAAITGLVYTASGLIAARRRGSSRGSCRGCRRGRPPTARSSRPPRSPGAPGRPSGWPRAA